MWESVVREGLKQNIQTEWNHTNRKKGWCNPERELEIKVRTKRRQLLVLVQKVSFLICTDSAIDALHCFKCWRINLKCDIYRKRTSFELLPALFPWQSRFGSFLAGPVFPSLWGFSPLHTVTAAPLVSYISTLTPAHTYSKTRRKTELACVLFPLILLFIILHFSNED